MQVLPSINLTPFIKHYLFLESDSEDVRKFRLFSDGNTGFVFSLGKKLISNIDDQNKYEFFPYSFFYGQISEFKDLYFVNNISLVIVVFQPTGINQLTSIPAFEFKDSLIESENILGKQTCYLHERLCEKKSIKDRLTLLNTFFSELADKRGIYTDSLPQQAVNFILKNKGLTTVMRLTKYIGYTERHIERCFNHCIGLSPKKYCTIVRLHYLLGLIKEKQLQHNLTAISYDAGYADQAHAIRDFKKLTGITPKAYSENNNRLTVNLIELN